MEQRSRNLRAWTAVHEGPTLLLGFIAVAAFAFLTSGSELASFIVTEYARSVPFSLLLPLVAAFLISLHATYGCADLARTASRSLMLPRLLWVLGLASMYLLAVVAPCVASGCAAIPVARNLLLFTALSVLGLVLIGSSLGWMPLGLYAMAFLFFGQTQFGGQDPIRWWAIPMRETVGLADLGFCALIFVAAVGVYSLRGERTTTLR